MNRALPSLLIASALAGCSTDDSGSSGHSQTIQRTIAVDVSGGVGLSLSSTTFALTPKGATVSFDCDGTPTNHNFVPVDANNGTWTFTGTVAKDCTTPTMVNVKFTRADQPAAGARTVRAGLGFIRDPLGGASYRLVNATLTIDYWGATNSLSQTVNIDHDSRFSSHSFAFTGGHSCPVGQSGTLRLSDTADRFTITMPHDSNNTPNSMTGSGDAGFIGPATNNGTSIDYVFSFSNLTPDANNDYSVTVTATWPDGANPDAYCGGTLNFRLVDRHFSLQR